MSNQRMINDIKNTLEEVTEISSAVIEALEENPKLVSNLSVLVEKYASLFIPIVNKAVKEAAIARAEAYKEIAGTFSSNLNLLSIDQSDLIKLVNGR